MPAQPAIDESPALEDRHDDITVIRPRRPGRKAGLLIGFVVLGLAGGGVWWHQAVTAEPGLVFDGGANVFRTVDGGDITGIDRVENSFGTDVNVKPEANGQLHGFFGLYNDGSRPVRIEAVPAQGFYYWAFDGAAVSEDWRTAAVGRNYAPFRPFTLGPGQTRYVRLDFRQADCDPAGLQDGSSRVDSLPVRYRTLGVTRTADVPFDEVTIAVQTVGSCDRPL